MSLDDRLRGTYQRQVEEVERQLATRSVDTGTIRADSPLAGRLVAMAAVLLAVVGGALAVARLAEDNSGSIDTNAGESFNAEQSTQTVVPTTATTEPATTAVEPATTLQVTTRQETTLPARVEAPDIGETTASTILETDTTLQEIADGIETTVCQSGARAELEAAGTRYIGENRGWGRKNDLVDEQNARYYFEAWEPNYELPVKVEVTLSKPVLATDIRVFQDPFTPVAGTITIDIGDQQVGIELSGTDGWRVHNFTKPILVDRFTIGRDGPQSNIMEVMLCLSSQ